MLHPVLCLSRGALRGPCSHPLSPPSTPLPTASFLWPQGSLPTASSISPVTLERSHYPVTDPLSSLNPTVSNLSLASFTMSDPSASPCPALTPILSLTVAGPLLAPLVSRCLIPHPQGKPTYHCDRGCVASQMQSLRKQKLIFSQVALVRPFLVLCSCVRLHRWHHVLRGTGLNQSCF